MLSQRKARTLQAKGTDGIIVKDYDISENKACKLTSLPCKIYYYKSQKVDTTVIEALKDFAFKYTTY